MRPEAIVVSENSLKLQQHSHFGHLAAPKASNHVTTIIIIKGRPGKQMRTGPNRLTSLPSSSFGLFRISKLRIFLGGRWTTENHLCCTNHKKISDFFH